jgi:hypothetical protein
MDLFEEIRRLFVIFETFVEIENHDDDDDDFFCFVLQDLLRRRNNLVTDQTCNLVQTSSSLSWACLSWFCVSSETPLKHLRFR